MAGSGTAHLRPAGEALLRAEHLTVEFPVGRTGLKVHAVSDVSLDIVAGETLGLVGESGCGKTTVGRTILRLIPATGGEVLYKGQDFFAYRGESLRRLRRQMQRRIQAVVAERRMLARSTRRLAANDGDQRPEPAASRTHQHVDG